MIACDTLPASELVQEKASRSSRVTHRHTVGQLERNERIEKYFHLVEKVLTNVMRNLPSHVNADDLRSAGVVGLISAAERFNPAQAGAFAGYASIRIRGAMLDELRRFDPSSRSARARSRKIQAAVEQVEQELGRPATNEEVSAKLGIPVAQLAEWRESSGPIRVISLDIHSESDTPTCGSLHEMIADDNAECVRASMEKEELLKLLSERMEQLPQIEKQILAFYYFEDMRFAEIGEALNLTESRICQIHKQSMTKLRTVISAKRQS
jgi:RNA polymerase sigma factor FliA